MRERARERESEKREREERHMRYIEWDMRFQHTHETELTHETAK